MTIRGLCYRPIERACSTSITKVENQSIKFDGGTYSMPPIQFATPAPTFEDVWRMFQENAQQSKEDHRLMKERMAETDRQMKEQLAETELRNLG